MAQAVYDPTKQVRRFGQQRQQQALDTIAQRNAAKPSISADLPEVGTATQAEYDAALERSRAARAAQGTGAGPVPQARPVAPSSLSPDEAASFQRQNPNFGRANPTAPTVENVQARTNMGASAPPRTASISEGLGAEAGAASAPAAQTASLATRAGQATRTAVNTAGKVGRLGLPAAKPMGALRSTGVGAIAADIIGTGFGEGESSDRPTEDYYTRLGMDPKTVGQSVVKDTAARTAGVLSDVGANLVDHLVIQPGNKLGQLASDLGATSPALTGQADTLRSSFADTPAGPAPAPKPDFSNVTGSASTVAVGAKERLARQAANEGITPVADRTGNPDEVLGTFNGKPVTRAESDRLSGGSSGLTAPSITQGLTSGYQPPAGGGVSAGNPGGGSEDRLREINDSSSPAGKIYAALAADKTPTGKRVAAQFLDTYVGTGTTERGQNASLSGDALAANASLQRGREGDAANLEQTRIASKRASQPQYVFNDDGSIGQISDGVLSTVKDENGAPAKASKGKGGALEAVKAREATISEMVGKPSDYGDPEEYQRARQQALAQLMAELGGASNGG